MFEKFADPVLIQQMTLSEKISVALFVTLLGMMITFAALIVLWWLTAFYSKLVRNFENKDAGNTSTAGASSPAPAQVAQNNTQSEENDDELVAVLAAAIAMATGRQPHNLVVRQIRQVIDSTPAWGQAGRISQMNSRM